MIGIVLLLAFFICVSSIFFPVLRKLALCLITTGGLFVGGIWVLIELTNK